MYSIEIKIAIEVNRAVLVVMTIPTLGFNKDNVEEVIVEPDPIENSVKIRLKIYTTRCGWWQILLYKLLRPDFILFGKQISAQDGKCNKRSFWKYQRRKMYFCWIGQLVKNICLFGTYRRTGFNCWEGGAIIPEGFLETIVCASDWLMLNLVFW